MSMPVLIIGAGNSYRSDDAVGLVIAKRLRQEVSKNIKILEQEGEAMALIDDLKEAENVILVDALSSNAEPGTIYKFDTQTEYIPPGFFSHSTHSFDVVEAFKLSCTLNGLPERLIMYGVVGKDFRTGISLSREVDKAVEEVVKRVLLELQDEKLRGLSLSNLQSPCKTKLNMTVCKVS